MPIAREPCPQRRQRITDRAAARFDADRLCYCFPWHRNPLSAFAGNMKRPGGEVAELFGKVAANAGIFRHAAATWPLRLTPSRNAR